MPSPLIENLSNSTVPRFNKSLLNAKSIRDLEGYYDEPILPDGSMEEALGANTAPAPPPRRAKSRFETLGNNLIDAVVQVESSGKWDAVSPAGAIGLMQVRPQYAVQPGFGARDVFNVAEEMGRKVNHIPKTEEGAKKLLLDPEINRAYGTQYLKSMSNRFEGNVEHALIAYNWGPNNTLRWIADGADKRKLPKETQRYLIKIQSELGEEDAS